MTRWLPLTSAAVITVFGLAMIAQAFITAGLVQIRVLSDMAAVCELQCKSTRRRVKASEDIMRWICVGRVEVLCHRTD